MAEVYFAVGASVALPKPGLDGLLANLRHMGYQTLGPQVKDEAIVYGPLQGMDELPRGYVSEQDAGRYRLVHTGHERYFDVTPGACTWKQFLFPPLSQLAAFRQTKEGQWQLEAEAGEILSYAFVGVRPCELAAIQVQDRVFLREDWSDPIYRVRRQGAFILAVNCLHPGGTCFCASMGSGPKAGSGFDLCLTELDDVFVIEIGSETGRMALERLQVHPASAFWLRAVQNGLEEAAQKMGRTLPEPDELPDLLLNNLEAERWEDVARRCMSCTSCTQVCPTCFCWDTRDFSDLGGETARRERVWDSCFNPDYSYVAGGNTRPNTRSRYRQWLTHKFGSWQAQFGTRGCVGCGRCITWCPAGIDVTVEVAAIREEVRS
jgi:sulfhydrogenase subunit beta (sulfur reductase)